MTDVQLTQWLRHSVIMTLSICMFGQLHAYGQNLGHLLHGQIVLKLLTTSQIETKHSTRK